MRIAHSRTFKSGNSEAVRLPQGIGFGEGVDVEICRHGDTVSIRPKPRYTGRDLAERMSKFGPPPGPTEEREPIEFPERSGL